MRKRPQADPGRALALLKQLRAAQNWCVAVPAKEMRWIALLTKVDRYLVALRQT